MCVERGVTPQAAASQTRDKGAGTTLPPQPRPHAGGRRGRTHPRIPRYPPRPRLPDPGAPGLAAAGARRAALRAPGRGRAALRAPERAGGGARRGRRQGGRQGLAGRSAGPGEGFISGAVN